MDVLNTSAAADAAISRARMCELKDQYELCDNGLMEHICSSTSSPMLSLPLCYQLLAIWQLRLHRCRIYRHLAGINIHTSQA